MSNDITYEITEEKNLIESKEGITIDISEYGISYTNQYGFVVKDSDNSSTRLEWK